MNDLNAASPQSATQHPGYSGGLGPTALPQRQAAKEFYRALRRAQKAATQGNPELAVDWCRYAALMAWRVNPGLFYCHEMEQLLAGIGREYLGVSPEAAPSAEPPQRFLHVMSTAFERGGHTRAVSRWVEICAEFSPSERHSILISMQNADPLPDWLSRSVERTGGEIIQLPSGLSWLQAAAEIRSKSFNFDLVVLHIHPNDPLPDIAFHDRPRPVIFFRHADHAFNLGLDVAQVFADLRPVGHAMSERFCPSTARKVLLPIPLLDNENVLGSKADARRKLGLPADALIALTIGEPWKFIPMHGCNFSAVAQSLCAGNPRAHILAIGLSESEPFPGLGKSTGGRFMPVGFINDRRDLLELYYRATDVYLDAIPCSSLTAVLDAARHGLPVQRLCNPDQCLMWCNDPALDSVMPGATTQDEFIATVLEWLEWPEGKRAELGARFREAVLRDHCGASWKTNWLDPAIKAVWNSGEDTQDAKLEHAEGRCLDFPGLGKLDLKSDEYDGMLIAGIIGSDEYTPRPIRISGVFHSIKPLLFHAPAGGTMRRRFLMFRALVASCVPDRIRTAKRRMLRAILRNPSK